MLLDKIFDEIATTAIKPIRRWLGSTLRRRFEPIFRRRRFSRIFRQAERALRELDGLLREEKITVEDLSDPGLTKKRHVLRAEQEPSTHVSLAAISRRLGDLRTELQTLKTPPGLDDCKKTLARRLGPWIELCNKPDEVREMVTSKGQLHEPKDLLKEMSDAKRSLTPWIGPTTGDPR